MTPCVAKRVFTVDYQLKLNFLLVLETKNQLPKSQFQIKSKSQANLFIFQLKQSPNPKSQFSQNAFTIKLQNYNF